MDLTPRRQDDNNEGLSVNDGHARIRFGDVNHRRIKLLSLVVSIADHCTGQHDADAGQERRPHPGGQRGRRIRQLEILLADYNAQMSNLNDCLPYRRESTSVLALNDGSKMPRSEIDILHGKSDREKLHKSEQYIFHHSKL